MCLENISRSKLPKVSYNFVIQMPSGQKYELIGTLDHKGDSTTTGHYVTFLKDVSGQWRCFDDKTITKCIKTRKNLYKFWHQVYSI